MEPVIGPEFKSRSSLIPKSTLVSITPPCCTDRSLRLEAPQVFWSQQRLEVMGGYNHGDVKGRRTELVGPVSGMH